MLNPEQSHVGMYIKYFGWVLKCIELKVEKGTMNRAGRYTQVQILALAFH